MIVIISNWEMPKIKHIETNGQTVTFQWTLALVWFTWWAFMAQCVYKTCASECQVRHGGRRCFNCF